MSQTVIMPAGVARAAAESISTHAEVASSREVTGGASRR
jgi:hypothetical protein